MQINVIGRLRDEKAWPEPLFAEVSRRLATEGGTINNCVTEPELGSISRGGTPTTSATRTEGGWLINGRKIFVTGAPTLRYLVTAVVLPPSEDAPSGTIASAIVEAGTPGLDIEPKWNGALSLRTCGNADVVYRDVFVPDERVVERRPIGVPGKRPGASGWMLSVSAIYLGIGQAALEAACTYANTRIPSSLNKPIAEQAHIQSWIGDMQIRLMAARAVLHDAARTWVEEPAKRDALAPQLAAAKYLCTNLPLERYFRDARAGLFFPPQDDLALTSVGRAALAAAQSRS
jgi:alkylation response protein AidB-like acyl-CoA dehydrogenase